MVVGAWCCVYVVLWHIYVVVCAVSAYDSNAIQVSGIVVLYDFGVCCLYGSMWNNWVGGQSGQLAIQHYDSRIINDNRLFLGANKAI